MGTAADPLPLLARMALDDEEHHRVRARLGPELVIEERDDHGQVVRRWEGSRRDWDRALHEAAGQRTPSMVEVETAGG